MVTTAEGALTAVREHGPDLVLLDIGLPDQSGIAAGKRILEARPETRVVALTALEDVQTTREALRVGFAGYLTKDTHPDQLARALRSVLNGQIVMPQQFGKAVSSRRNEHGSRPSPAEILARQLTPRELEVLALLAEGATSRRIAEELGVSPNTVRTHVQGILSKLQVHSRLEAAAFAVRHGLVKVRS